MALPVRVERGHGLDPFEIARQDFNSMLSRFFGSPFAETGEGGPLGTMGQYGVDIREDGDHIYVEADLPGFNKDDVDISLENGTLTIMAERRDETAEPAGTQRGRGRGGQQAQGQQGQHAQQGQQAQTGQQQQTQQRQRGDYLLHERRFQRFVRSFTLPPNVDEQNVQAKLDNGVLKITLNKREDAKPRRIQLQ